jgi:hypothetical protein
MLLPVCTLQLISQTLCAPDRLPCAPGSTRGMWAEVFGSTVGIARLHAFTTLADLCITQVSAG